MNSETSLELYKKMLLIRKAEEKIIELYHEDEMKTPMHMSMGSEAISAGVCQALDYKDPVFGTYRSHALYLAKTDDVEDFFAEMYGKDTAFLKGRGGSMHMCSPHKGFMGTSAIVGSVIPIALGVAFANKKANENRVVTVFFGDGATEEGAFWESLNLACLLKLPIIFVCEDNGLAVHTDYSKRKGYDSLMDIVSAFNCNVFDSDLSTDVETVYGLTLMAIEDMEDDQKPAFIHLKYYRYLEHVGVNQDFHAGYRSREEFEKWQERDPLSLQRNRIIESDLPEDRLAKLEKEIDSRISQAVSQAKEAPFSHHDEVSKFRWALNEK